MAVFAFLLALALTREIKGTNFFRTAFFMPNLIGGIVLGYIWQLIINGILAGMGVDLTYSATYGFWGLVAVMNWQMIGYMMIIYVAGFTNVPGELIEAAKVDGASPWRTFWNVRLPMIRSSITICLFLAIVRSFMVFEVNMSLTDGGPYNSTEMIAYRIYNTAFVSLKFGDAQAQAVVLFIIVAAISVLQAYFTSRKEVEL
jgi:raffinose/stachyose/melibiose transport system permease protein